jgi:hypothetical protein
LKLVKLIWNICLLVCLVLGVSRAPMANTTAEEHLFKAAYIFNFAKLTSWPKGTWQAPGSQFNLCTLGNDEVIDTLHKLSGRKIQGHAVSILDYASKNSKTHCHLLYIAKTSSRHTRRIMNDPLQLAVLTVGDFSGFLAKGGMIEIYRENNRTRFKVNTGNASRQGLEISSRLLNLATVVEQRATP